MAEYISREDVKEMLRPFAMSVCLSQEELNGMNRAARLFRELLEEIPAADVVARDCYDRLLAENDELREGR